MSVQHRGDRYADFDQMEYTPEIASALDIYADEMTTFNVYNRMLKIQCPDEEIKPPKGAAWENKKIIINGKILKIKPEERVKLKLK